jgi:hypothetical protein
VNRIQKTFTLLAVLAIPAGAHSTLSPAGKLCFASGGATYRIAPYASSPDYRVRIDRDAPAADLRMRLADRPEAADFVLVDDFGASERDACGSSARIRTVKIDPATPVPDVTVSLTAEGGPADYSLYVHSVRFSHQDAAALLAAMWKAEQRRKTAALAGR